MIRNKLEIVRQAKTIERFTGQNVEPNTQALLAVKMVPKTPKTGPGPAGPWITKIGSSRSGYKQIPELDLG